MIREFEFNQKFKRRQKPRNGNQGFAENVPDFKNVTNIAADPPSSKMQNVVHFLHLPQRQQNAVVGRAQNDLWWQMNKNAAQFDRLEYVRPQKHLRYVSFENAIILPN